MRRILALGIALSIAAMASVAQAGSTGSPQDKQLIEASGVHGGLVVRIGAASCEQLTALHASDAYLVQGLDTDPAVVARTRAELRSAGLCGAVSVDRLQSPHLPYVDNIVSLLVADDLGQVPMTEVMRVLRPDGVAMIAGKKTVKPHPGTIDKWTHYLHDPGNNAVADDTVIGPPRHLQWLAGPRWTRTHHQLNSVSSAVTAGDRLFAIVDEATDADMTVPSKWSIIAYDAFSGIRLWRKPIDSWVRNTVRFRSGPPQATRLLVTDGRRVYAPLALSAPVSAIDATTGKTIATYQATNNAEEIILIGKVLLVLTGDPVAEQAAGVAKARGIKLPNKKVLVAIDVETGKTMWKWADGDARPMPETLAADAERAYIQSGGSVVCFDLQTGEVRWQYGDPKGEKRGARLSFGRNVLVVSDGVVLCDLGKDLDAIDAGSGQRIWNAPGGMGFHAPMDVFVIRGVVWTGSHPKDSVAPLPVDDFSVARDLHTGKVLGTNSIMADLQTAGHHHRCYREKATTRYILGGKRGIELMGLDGAASSRNNWIRGTCQYGILPANGLLYTPPHACGCYMEAKLSGFLAVASKAASRPVVADADRLTKGPAYGQDTPAAAGPADWPQLRGNALRNGVAAAPVSAKLTAVWKAPVSGKLTPPVVAAGKVLVASIDAGTVFAIDEKTGKTAWVCQAGGRVDSPPAMYDGKALFGSADGNVYCVRLSDGQLVWRFQAARADVQTVSYNRVESLWPVHGSVMVLDGTAYFAAGRSTYLDGGIDMYALDPATGSIRHKRTLTSQPPVIGEGKDQNKSEYDEKVAQNVSDYKTYLQADKSDSFSMAGGTVADVLTSDGTNVFMHQEKFDTSLNPQAGLTRHLFSTSDLLDGAENHRSHWVLGTGDFSMVPVAYSWIVNGTHWRSPGIAVPVGLMMSFTDKTLWTVRRHSNKGTTYSLHAKANTPFSADEKPRPDFRKDIPASVTNSLWKAEISFRPRAMLKAGGNLMLAGHPTSVNGIDRNDLYAGHGPGVLAVISASDGKTLATYDLQAPPVWDGMAAANGKLYVCTTDGRVVCLGPAAITK